MKPFTPIIQGVTSMRIFLVHIMAIVTLVSCRAEVSKEAVTDEIIQLQGQLIALSLSGSDEQQYHDIALQIRTSIDKYVDLFPEDEAVTNLLFYAANLEAEILGNFEEAVALLDEIKSRDSDPDMKKRALFMMAYTYSEMIRDFEKADALYQRFLEKYPDSELAESARVQRQMMGKNPSDFEFLREFRSSETE